MTQKYKEILLNILETLYRANDCFDKISELETFLEFCGECQTAAFDIGTRVEQADKHPDTVVSHLEDYCELIYQLSSMFRDTSQIEGQIHKIKETLDRVRDGVSSIPILKEVVFLPYKASMWDCFHSIYEECRKNPEFQVYVVPVPYYSLDANRNIEFERYEGQEISKFVEITDYREYSLAEREPDVIFIHNPYDQYNSVTQLPKDYFSSELIKYTNHLVYIPYYVLENRISDIMATMPGIRNSWKTIVQSETLRHQLIQSGMRENQIVALGSPKFDMVLDAERKYRELPEEWSVLRGKRVYLYNTHLLGLMNRIGEFLQKILQILDYFGKRNDVVLLWRPHPLSQETLQRYHPEALATYLKIVEWFKECGNGVYDDSENLERAIALSDAYMGDEQSSVSTLYKVTGKPMYYINYDSNKLFEKERYARCLCAEKAGNKIYMFSWEYNCIFVYDEMKQTISCKKGNFELAGYEKNLCVESIRYENFIYFFPCQGGSNMIVKFDTVTEKSTYIELDTDGVQFNPVNYQNVIYLMPVYYSSKIPYFTPGEDQIHYLEISYDEEQRDWKSYRNMPIFYGAIQIGDCVWRSASSWGNCMQKYDFNTHRFEYIQVKGLEKKVINAAVYDGIYFWILAENLLLKWDHKNNQILDTICLNKETDSNTCNSPKKQFAWIHYFNHSIWVLPYKGTKILVIDTDNHKKTEILCDDWKDFSIDLSGGQAFAEKCILDGEMMYLLPYRGNSILRVCAGQNQMALLDTKCSTSQILEALFPGNIWNEGMCDLETFVSLSQSNTDNSEKVNHDPVGKVIWRYIEECLYKEGNNKNEVEK